MHGFGISGTYLEPTAVLLAPFARHFIPDLPGTGRSDRPRKPLDIPGSMQALIAYCDVVGLERATFVGNSLGSVTLLELAVAHPDRVDGIVLVSPAGGPNNQPLFRAMTRYPTLDRLALLDVPTLVVDGAHALNFTHPVTVAALFRAQLDGTVLTGELAHDETMEVVFDDR